MKKSTKILITVSVVAAVAGIGAISYAKWTEGASRTQELSGTTGTIRTIGSLTVTPSADSGTLDGMNPLYPVDQGGSYLNYWEFTLETDITDGTPVYKLAGELPEGVTGAKLYWSATAPEADIIPDAQKQLTSTAKELTGLTDDTVYVYMVASGTDAMKASISLTFFAE